MRFHLDEHVAPAIAAALRRRGIDVTTTADAGLIAATDLAHIEFALQSRRVIVRADADFITLAMAGAEHSGIVFFHATRGVTPVIRRLLLIDACLDESEMRKHIEFC